MAVKVILSKDDYIDERYTISPDYDYDYCITINTDLSEDFSSLITDYDEFTKCIEKAISFNKAIAGEVAHENLEFLTECLDISDEILFNAEYVEFDFSVDEIINYIKRNPILKTKKIILNESFGLNVSILDRIYNELSGNVNNLYFKLSDNFGLVSFNECKKTYEKLEKLANEIKQFDFSPLEKIMYVYDVVRNKIYVEVDENDDKNLSRDLSSVLFGDKIVCLGYARILDALLSMLGIETRIVYLHNKNGKSGHARNEIYIQDDKYGVDGVYYFDATWDSKKEEYNNNYLLSYRYFVKTKSEMDLLDGGKIIDRRFPYFSSDIMWEFKETMDEFGFDALSEDMIKSINYMSTLINGKYLIDLLNTLKDTPFYGRVNTDKITSELADLVDYFDRPLSADVLLRALYNVRKIQYYMEPLKFPFGIEQFYKTVLISDWSFDGITPEEKLLSSIFGDSARINGIKHMRNFDNVEEMSKKIGQVKLTRTLRKVYENKKEENS